MKIYAARHGETEWNRLNKVCGRTDLDLTEKGEAQLLEYRKQWNDYKNAINKLMNGSERGGKND